ncbi:MAG: class I SAM-dependent methyltransferase, partial [Planctomycetota bacterium]
MHTLAPAHESARVKVGLRQRWARRIALQRLQRLTRGHLRIVDAAGSSEFGSASGEEPSVELTVTDPSFYSKLVLGGSLGAAESYLEGGWRVTSLVDLFRLFVRNPQLNTGVEGGLARLAEPWNKFRYWLRRNTLSGSKKNIAEHYDLSNELFEQFLDPTMSYSSVMYRTEGATLDEGALHKLDEICRKLQLGPEDHLLEIGTGWGGLAVHAARTTGCRVTTTTISREQYSLACERVAEAGLSDRVEVLLSDYRDLQGQYDKLVSVEMIEAVG